MTSEPHPHRCLLVLLDGLGDRNYQELDNQTPLQAASTPNLDRIAGLGANGLFHATLAGEALPSENAHFVIFGYDLADFPGRGALEALGEDISLAEDDVALLAHFVTVEEDRESLLLIDGKPELSREEVESFSDVIRHMSVGKISLEFIPTGGIRGILKISNGAKPFFTDTDPFFSNRYLAEPVPLAAFKSDTPTLESINALKKYLLWCTEQLAHHPLNLKRLRNNRKPINGLVTQRAGQLGSITPFPLKNGLKALSISTGPMYRGLCRYLGLDHVEGLNSGEPEEDLLAGLQQARNRIDQYDFIHVHSKWPDVAAHTKNPVYKKEVIESLDRAIGAGLAEVMDDPRTLVVIAADHSTPSYGPLVHSGEPVPVIFCGNGVRGDRITSYDEVNAATGSLGFIRGREFFSCMINAINKAKLKGIQYSETDCPTWSGLYQPFKKC